MPFYVPHKGSPLGSRSDLRLWQAAPPGVGRKGARTLASSGPVGAGRIAVVTTIQPDAGGPTMTRQPTTVVNIARGEQADVYIGRAGRGRTAVECPWGNPFVIGRDGTRDEVIAKYEAWVQT